MSVIEFVSGRPPPELSDDEGSDDDKLVSVDSLVAVWWKRRQRETGKMPRKSESPGARSTLVALKKLAETKKMMREKVEELSKRRKLQKADQLLLTCLLSDLGEYSDSIKVGESLVESLGLSRIHEVDTPAYLKGLESLSNFKREVLWQMARIRLQLQSTVIPEPQTFRKNKICAVARVPEKEFSVGDFKQHYSAKCVPVVITGMKVSKKPWSLEYVKEKAVNKKAPLKKGCKDSVEWARLEPSQETSVTDFIESIERGESNGRYLFDWSLPIFFPELDEEFNLPAYFKDDYLKRTSAEALYRKSWPSLFISGKGTVSELHVDAFGSNFWMYLFCGRKRWTFFNSTDVAKLKPKYHDSLDPVFEADLSNDSMLEDYEHKLTVSQVTLEPGELLFVPHGSPHRVENLEDSVAVSGNFVDESNIENAVKHLRINALLDPRSQELLKELCNLKLID